ncbi:DNA polymerase III subunit beta [Desulfofundulus thermobenzoicus]|uniref:Beta sliding clamp n=1 Tax=Desulfofundulus thermobenzoicus TaxID=29376 RepID=A0A6N7IP56_9FIRM|nr:DNA polymerase III subunit beta [Desulfofundulus thermobenzoicus]MQL51815.1 DNA polymerase III subunit beta [Desulfofundulus thermobenzoicus]
MASVLFVDRARLSEAVQLARKAVSARSPLPVLSCVRLASGGETLTVAATDLDREIEVAVPCRGGDFEAVLPAKELAELLRFLPDGEIEIEKDGDGAVLRYAGNSARISGFSADQFPERPENARLAGFSTDAGNLKDALRRVVFAASDDTTRPVFTAVCVDLEGSGARFTATDTHRLVTLPLEVQRYGEERKSVLLPKEAVNDLIGALGGLKGNEEAEVFFDRSGAEVRAGGVRVWFRLVAGAFPPDTARLFSVPHSFAAEIPDMSGFELALRRAKVFAENDKNKSAIAHLHFTDNALTVSSGSDRGGVVEKIPVTNVEGGDLRVSFRIDYLLDVLEAIEPESKSLTFKFCSETETGTNPYALIAPSGSGEDGYRSIVLPVRK